MDVQNFIFLKIILNWWLWKDMISPLRIKSTVRFAIGTSYNWYRPRYKETKEISWCNVCAYLYILSFFPVASINFVNLHYIPQLIKPVYFILPTTCHCMIGWHVWRRLSGTRPIRTRNPLVNITKQLGTYLVLLFCFSTTYGIPLRCTCNGAAVIETGLKFQLVLKDYRCFNWYIFLSF